MHWFSVCSFISSSLSSFLDPFFELPGMMSRVSLKEVGGRIYLISVLYVCASQT